MRRYGMRTILDLRRMDRPCKQAAQNKHEARLRRIGTVLSKVRCCLLRLAPGVVAGPHLGLPASPWPENTQGMQRAS